MLTYLLTYLHLYAQCGSALSHLFLLHTWLPALPIFPSICTKLALLIEDEVPVNYSNILIFPCDHGS